MPAENLGPESDRGHRDRKESGELVSQLAWEPLGVTFLARLSDWWEQMCQTKDAQSGSSSSVGHHWFGLESNSVSRRRRRAVVDHNVVLGGGWRSDSVECIIL